MLRRNTYIEKKNKIQYMSTIKVKYVEDTDDAPFLNYDRAEIVLTIEGNLYAVGNDDDFVTTDMYYGIDFGWSINSGLKGEIINDILKEIKPIAAKILKNHSSVYNEIDSRWEGVNTDDDLVSSLYRDIENIISDYEDDESNIISLIHYYDYVDGSENPPAFRDFIDNGDLLDEYGVVFYESSDEIYEKLTEDIVEDIYDNSDSYESASKIIKSVYSDYKKEGYVDDFWNDLIPKLIDIDYYDIYSVSGRNLYYNDQLIKL